MLDSIGLLAFVLLAHGEAPAPDFRYLADDDEAVGIDVTGQLFDLGHLMVGYHAEDHFRGGMEVAALAVEDGNAPVHLGENGDAHVVGLAADDFDLCTAGAHQQDLVQGKGNHHEQQNTVEQVLGRMEGHLRQHDAEIEGPQADSHRDIQQLFQHQRGDIHAAGGGTAPDHHAQRTAQSQTGVEGIQQQILGDPDISQGSVQDLQGNGVEQGGEHCGQGKLAAEKAPAENQHGDVENKNEAGNGDAGQMVDGHGQTRGAAADEIGRKHKQFDGQGVQNVSCYNQQKGYPTFLIHVMTP